MINLVIVEDHPAIAEGLAALLGSEPDVHILGMAGDRASAQALIERSHPDVVLCDVMQAGIDGGLELLGDFAGRTPAPAFVMYSAYSKASFMAKAIARGAAAYVSKLEPAEEILRVIREAARGRRLFAPDTLRAARGALRAPTPRELETIGLVAQGHTNEEIATALSIQVKTVESRLRRLFDRYDVTNRMSLVYVARQEGWLLDLA
jgi:DNA-binding NarL/FixJ family response regulator